MRRKLGALAIVSFALMSGQHPAVGPLQKPVNNKDEAATPLPLTLRGIPSKQIMLGQQAKFLPDLALLDQDNRQVLRCPTRRQPTPMASGITLLRM